MAYTKLFNSIVTSTIWTEDDRTRIVWITMLACADKNGEVYASIPGLARVAAVPVEDCRAAIARFLSPDPDSRTKDDEGRRVEEIDGGWSLLNFRKYRQMASKEDAQAAEASRKARYRARMARNVPNVPECPKPVQGVSTVDPHIAEAEAHSEAEAEADREQRVPSTEPVAASATRVHHPSACESVWQASWTEARPGQDAYELTKADVIALNRIGKKHGPEKLRAKADALLGDLDPWVFQNASPTLLVKRWSNLGGPKPVKMTQGQLNVQATLSVADELDRIEARGRAAREAR